MLHAGQLRDRVDLLERRSRKDRAGQPVEQWVVVAKSVPAEVRYKSGSEGERGDRRESEATHEVRLRYRRGVSPETRIRWGTVVLTVFSVGDPYGTRRELLMLCAAV